VKHGERQGRIYSNEGSVATSNAQTSWDISSLLYFRSFRLAGATEDFFSFVDVDRATSA